MTHNVGGYDRILRIVAGVALITYAAIGHQPLAYLGIIPLLTGLFSFCPLYTFVGLNSCKCGMKKEEEDK